MRQERRKTELVSNRCKRAVTTDLLGAFHSLAQRSKVKHKPPSFQVRTLKTGSDPGGKATLPSSATAPHPQSRPIGAAPSPHRPVDGTHVFKGQTGLGMLRYI